MPCRRRFPEAAGEGVWLGGELARNVMSMAGEICAIRFYNRPLSDAEIAHNAAIDAVRFGIVQ